MFISIASIKLAQRVATKSFSFGYARAEVLGAMVSVMLIWALTGILVYEAINRLITLQEVDGLIMFIVACIGLAVNLLMMVVLGGHGHSHGGGDDHCAHGDEGGDMNVDAAWIHVLGDLVQTIGVLIAAILIWAQPFDVGTVIGAGGKEISKWNYADPVCTCVFACLVLTTTYGIVKESILVLMQGTPKGADLKKLETEMIQISNVIDCHDIHVWMATRSKWVLSCHLKVSHDFHGPEEKCCATDAILGQAQSIAEKQGYWHTTIQIEHEGGWSCNTNCKEGELPGQKNS